MRRYEIVEIIARRLGMKVGRVRAILGRLQESGAVGTADCKRHPESLAEPEIVALVLAVLSESGVASAPAAARTFAALTTDHGDRLDMLLNDVLFGPTRSIRHLVLRQSPPGVSVVVDGGHVLFGEPPSRSNASPARIVAGETLAALAAELQGQTPQQADAAAEIARLGLSLGRIS